MRYLLPLVLAVFTVLLSVPTFVAADAGGSPMVLEGAEADVLLVAVFDTFDVSSDADTVFDVTGRASMLMTLPDHMTEVRAAELQSRTGPDGFQTGIWRPVGHTRDFSPTRTYASGLSLRRL